MKSLKMHLVISTVCFALTGSVFAQGAGGGNGGGGAGGGSAGQGGTGMGTPNASDVTGAAPVIKAKPP
ncbi:hypothetical protein [Paraburkholderia caribensis]|uniref:hypothetical protein n=1 Tax=Paraburkholderia caribensis TaxID=75105 RepID=UPI001CC7C2C8|nr:hypothetical protein [Paraburkholderia caribensis]